MDGFIKVCEEAELIIVVRGVDAVIVKDRMDGPRKVSLPRAIRRLTRQIEDAPARLSGRKGGE